MSHSTLPSDLPTDRPTGAAGTATGMSAVARGGASRATARLAALLAMLLLAATACGPRFDREALVVAGDVGAGAVDAGSGSGPVAQPGLDGQDALVDPTAPGGPAPGDAGGEAATDDGAPAPGGPGATDDPATPADEGNDGSSPGPAPSQGGGTTTPPAGSGSGGGQPAAPADAGPSPGVTDEGITIGYLLPLTGAAPLPAGFDDGVNVYWNWLNANGGINGRRVTVNIYDTQSNTSNAVAQARRAVQQDKVFTLLSLDRLEVQDAIARFLEQVGMPHLMVQSPAAPPASWANTFVASVDHIVQGRGIATFMGQELGAAGGARKVAFVREQTNALKPGTDAFEARAAELGMQVVARLTTDPANNDQSGTVNQLQASGAEVVWLYMAPTVAANIVSSAGARGYRPTWFANNISWQFELMHNVTAGFLEGSYAFSSWVPLNDPRANKYKEEYRRQISDPTRRPDDIGLVGWGAGEVVSAILDEAGRDLGWNSFRSAIRGFKKPGNVWTGLDFTRGIFGAEVVKVYKSDGAAWSLVEDDRVLR